MGFVMIKRVDFSAHWPYLTMIEHSLLREALSDAIAKYRQIAFLQAPYDAKISRERIELLQNLIAELRKAAQ
jgi:hypothetical protein